MSIHPYPVHVNADLEPGLNRWLWLVKWLLAIPHYVVLAFLWLAFLALSVVAFVAILVTGRYPHTIFDFNVGVLRWSWRVAYYTYGALATDRYPPFTLAERSDYPAHLEVDYPEHLSRGLVLVKWWLLALPHYLVLAFFLGGGVYVATQGTSEQSPLLWDGGLIGLLVLVAAAVLLFTGRYPQPVFDLVLGMNRWVLRVAAYAALMTDEYPPFRLDQGGHDPEVPAGTVTVSPPPPGAATAPAAPVAPERPGTGATWSAGRIVAVVVGSIFLLGSFGVATGAATLGVAANQLRDDAGFVMSDPLPVTAGGYAVTSGVVALHRTDGGGFLPSSWLGDGKVTVTGTGGEPVFVGVAGAADAAAYLRGVAHATVTDVDVDGAGPHAVYRTSGTAAPPVVPAQAGIWVASSSGTGGQSIVWPVEEGDWTVVLMNADGSAGVTGKVAAGATVPVLGWVVGGLLVLAGVFALVALVVLLLALRSRPTPAGGRPETPR